MRNCVGGRRRCSTRSTRRPISIPTLTAAWLTTPNLWTILAKSPGETLALSYLFGTGWGVGGLTCGLGLRYLGLSLGQSVSLGFCVAFGTLIPPVFTGQAGSLFATAPGLVIVVGVVVVDVGIVGVVVVVG